MPVRPWAGRIIAFAAVMALCYFAKLVLVVLLFSVILALVLGWPVEQLERIHVPRGLGAALVITIVLGALTAMVWVGYGRFTDFVDQLPGYSTEIRGFWNRFTEHTRHLQSAMPEGQQPRATVRIANPTGIANVLSSLGPVGEVVLAISFIPFLTYFMLSWQRYLRDRTVRLFAVENRDTAQESLDRMVGMVRRFVLGNAVAALVISVLGMVAFGLAGVPFFYFVAFISGVLNLVPYLGVVLAPLPPLIAGLGHIHSTGAIVVVVTTVALHLVAINVILPKLVGSQLQLNPLAGTLALLFWAWVWGPMGLILGIPVTAAIKIVCDQVEPLQRYGAWLGMPEAKPRKERVRKPRPLEPARTPS